MKVSTASSWRAMSLGVFLFLLTGCLLTFAVAFPRAAWAEDEGAQPDDVQARVKKKLEKVLKLMRDNEAALLKLSTGQAAVPKKVDIEPPPQNDGGSAGEGSKGAGSSSGGASGGGLSGEEISKKLDEMIKGQRGAGGTIPDELKQVVQMIPL